MISNLSPTDEPVDDWCALDPLFCEPTVIPFPVGGERQGQVNVSINNAVNISDNALKSVAQAVKDGIAQGADSAAQVVSDTVNAVTTTVQKTADGIFKGVNAAFNTLGTWLSNIGNWIKDHLESIVSFIGNHIKDLADTVKATITDVIIPIFKQVATVINKVNDVLNNTIVPIFDTISRVFNEVEGLVAAIRMDINNGLQGILQLPGDIANSLGGLEATLDRMSQQLGGSNKEGTRVSIYAALDDTIGAHLRGLGSKITGTVGSGTLHTTFGDQVRLTEPDIAAAGAKTFEAIWKEIYIFIHDLFSFGKPSLDALKTLPIGLPFFLEGELSFPVLIIGITIAFVEAMEPLLEFIKDDINLKSGLAKLGPTEATAAWVRGFINDKTLEEELGVRGWDAGRIKVLKDLQVYLADVSTALDWHFRGIITEEDLRSNMKDHAIEGLDQDALIRGAYKLVDVGAAAQAFLRGSIDSAALDAVLRENRYSENETQLFKSLLLRPESTAATIERHKRNTLYSNHLTSDPIFNSLPGDIQDAAQKEGLDAQSAADLWMSQFQVPPLGHWLTLYFRGVRTRKELFAAMDYFRVPQEWRDDFIQANSALIPFRTIPAMLSAGIIDEAYAKQQLTAHGYDLRQVDALLKFALSKKPATAKVKAQVIHTTSVTTARQYWEHGTITDEQYSQILAEHGYDSAHVTLTIKLEKAQLALSERKAKAQAIVDEALAGLISYDQAVARLTAENYTPVEISKYARKLISLKRTNTKLPGEGELHHFLEKGIINLETYKTTMAAIGFSQFWVDAFAQWRGSSIA